MSKKDCGRREDISSSFIDTIKRYLELKAEFYKLSLWENIAILLGKMIFIFILGILCFTLFLLLLILFYDLLMQWVGAPWKAVLLEIAFVGILMCILLLFKDKLVIRPVANLIIRVLDSSGTEKKEK